jgi:hypothetical protein
MKKDDIIICINNSNIEEFPQYINGVKPFEPSPILRLTIGKEYKVHWTNDISSPNAVHVVDDYGAERNFYRNRFTTKKEWREQQLNKILNHE